MWGKYSKIRVIAMKALDRFNSGFCTISHTARKKPVTQAKTRRGPHRRRDRACSGAVIIAQREREPTNNADTRVHPATSIGGER